MHWEGVGGGRQFPCWRGGYDFKLPVALYPQEFQLAVG